MKAKGLSTICLFAALLVCSATIMPVLASSDERQNRGAEPRGGRKIEGVWDVRVSIRDCQTGGVITTVRATNMFIRGGTLTEQPARANLILRSPTFGTWRYIGDQQYAAVFRVSRFNPDGTFAATQRVTRTIELDREATAFTATALVELFDINDSLFQTGCATETATRLE